MKNCNTEYLQLRITFSGIEDEPKPQYIICFKILSNESMKSSKLWRHFEIKHDESTNKSLAFFIDLLGKLKKSSRSLSGNKKYKKNKKN